jgi:hypothetical protein
MDSRSIPEADETQLGTRFGLAGALPVMHLRCSPIALPRGSEASIIRHKRTREELWQHLGSQPCELFAFGGQRCARLAARVLALLGVRQPLTA